MLGSGTFLKLRTMKDVVVYNPPYIFRIGETDNVKLYTDNYLAGRSHLKVRRRNENELVTYNPYTRKLCALVFKLLTDKERAIIPDYNTMLKKIREKVEGQTIS